MLEQQRVASMGPVGYASTLSIALIADLSLAIIADLLCFPGQYV